MPSTMNELAAEPPGERSLSAHSNRAEPTPPAAPPPPDLAILSRLLDQHAPYLYSVAYHLMRNPHDAEDTVQETLLKLVRNPASLAGLRDERAFLASAVWRVGLNRLQSTPHRAQRRTQDVTVMPLPDPKPNPEQQAAAVDQRMLMRSLIDALPDTLRQPLLLSAIEDMRGSEVAAILGIPEPPSAPASIAPKPSCARLFSTPQPSSPTPARRSAHDARSAQHTRRHRPPDGRSRRRSRQLSHSARHAGTPQSPRTSAG